MKKNNKDLTPQEKLSHNPFAALLKGNNPEPASKPQGGQPEAHSHPPARAKDPVPNPTPNPGLKTGASGKKSKVVLRLERKGHGGKEMTRVEKLISSSTLLEQWLKEIKQSLGCGGVIDGEDLLIQGDQRDRLTAFFTKKGIQT